MNKNVSVWVGVLLNDKPEMKYSTERKKEKKRERRIKNELNRMKKKKTRKSQQIKQPRATAALVAAAIPIHLRREKKKQIETVKIPK